MADAVAIIGMAGAVADIILLLNTAINSLRNLHGHWKDADLIFTSFESQLMALKAALSKIEEWSLLEISTRPNHHQLVIDLDSSLQCCRTLIGKIEAHLARLQLGEEKKLKRMSKAILVLDGKKSMDRIAKMLERQTGALNLLLTACHCTTIAEQKALMESSSTQRVMKQIEDDSSSLCVHRDTTSILSRYTDTLSKLSLIFTFDKELLSSGIYQRIFRGSLKESIRQKQTDQARVRSKKIERSLRSAGKQLSTEVKILVIGEPSIKEAVIGDWLYIHKGPVSAEECSKWRENVRILSTASLRMVIKRLVESEMLLTHIDLDYVRAVCDDVLLSERCDQTPAKVLRTLWEDDLVQQFLQSWPRESSKETLHVNAIEALEDAMNPHFHPTHEDVLKIRERTDQIDEHQFSVKRLKFKIIEAVSLGQCHSDRIMSKKLMPFFETVVAATFVVDLTSYNSFPFKDDPSINEMHTTLHKFDTLINCRWMVHSTVIILFANLEEFCKKLVDFPLKMSFPDFEGGCKPDVALKYVRDRFGSLSRQSGYRRLYTYACDRGSAHFMAQAIANDMIWRSQSWRASRGVE